MPLSVTLRHINLGRTETLGGESLSCKVQLILLYTCMKSLLQRINEKRNLNLGGSIIYVYRFISKNLDSLKNILNLLASHSLSC